MSDLFSGLANLTKSVTDTLNSYEVRKISDKVQSYVMNFTEPEIKVREATTEEPWGPTPDIMREIASLTFQYDAFPEVMGMLWKRMLPPSPVAWRHTYKSLILLEYLLKNGCERVIANARDHAFEMRSLEHYKCVDERGKDQGINVRHRVKTVLSLIEDDDLLRAERRKAKMAGKDDKYRGFSRDEMSMRGFSGSSYSNNSSSSNNFSSKKSNFSMDSPYDRDNRYDDDDMPSGNREVTAFDFGGQKRDASPELGFPVESPVNHDDDDDGFGDFTSARSGNSSSAAAAASKPAKKNDDFFGGFGEIKAPPQNSSTSSPAPAKSPKKNDDFFADFGDFKSSPQKVNSSSIAAPTKSINKDDDFFGDFGDLKASLPTTTMNTQKSDDLFGDFGDLKTSAQSGTSSFIAAAPAMSMNKNEDMFGDFGDLKTSLPTTTTPTMNTQKSDDLFGDFFTKPSTAASSSQKTSQPSQQNSTASPANKSALWNDLSGSLDLDNLLSTKPKQSLSMNEMKNKQSMSGSNSFL